MYPNKFQPISGGSAGLSLVRPQETISGVFQIIGLKTNEYVRLLHEKR
jgi:hypothetical protein